MILGRSSAADPLDDQPPVLRRASSCWSSSGRDPDGAAAGGYLIAVDAVDAGVGERVLVLDEGNGARQVLGVGQRARAIGHRGDRDAIELPFGSE